MSSEAETSLIEGRNFVTVIKSVKFAFLVYKGFLNMCSS